MEMGIKELSWLDRFLGGFKEFDPWRRRVSGAAGWILSIFAIGSLVIMLVPDLTRCNRLLARLALVTAGILPPVYFWFEYNVIWRGAPDNKRPSLDEYKYAQEVARNLWLGFVAVLLALYFH